MKTKIVMIFIGVLLSNSLLAQNVKLFLYCPHPDQNEMLCGFMNSKKEIVIPVGKYANIYSIEFDKIAFVSLQGKTGIYAINRSEDVLFQVYSFDNGPDYVSNGLFRIVNNGRMGFADMNGEVVIKPIFLFVYPFQNNGLAVFNEGGSIVKDGEYHRYQGGKWGAINKKGEIVIPAIYEDGKPNGLKKNNKWVTVSELCKKK